MRLNQSWLSTFLVFEKENVHIYNHFTHQYHILNHLEISDLLLKVSFVENWGLG